MDLRLAFRVIRRFKIIVALGAILAVALAGFATYRVNPSTGKLTPRGSEQWISYARIFVTQAGFPYGQLSPRGSAATDFAANAVVYSSFADSDPVVNLAFGGPKPADANIQVAPVLASQSSTEALPIISIASTSDTPRKAMAYARAEMRGLISYVEQKQTNAKIREDQRVLLQVIKEPKSATLLKARSKTIPVVVFLVAMLGVIGFAFLLENLRPAAKSFVTALAPLEERGREHAAVQ
jgi:hypothetical protein